MRAAMLGQPGELGPVQIIVVGFDGNNFEGRILAELEELSERGIISLLDLLFVTKDESGRVAAVEASALGVEAAEEMGAILRALVGFGEEDEAPAEAEFGDADAYDDDRVWCVGDSVPPGRAAAIVLLEHLWAIPLREATEAASGEVLGEAWVHPLDLEAIGLTASDTG